MESAGTLWQLHPKAMEYCSADHVPGVIGEDLISCLSTHVLVEFEHCYLSMVSSPSTCTVSYTINNYITSH